MDRFITGGRAVDLVRSLELLGDFLELEKLLFSYNSSDSGIY